MTSMEVDGAGTSSARRRRERRLRSWWRHERMSVAAALAEAHHHSAPKVGAETHYALRRQKTASAARPGVLEDPAPQGAVTVGYVAAPVPTLALSVLAGSAGEAVDDRSLRFLLGRSLAETKEEEKKAKEKKEELDQARRELRTLLAVPEPRRTAEQETRVRACRSVLGAAYKRKRKRRTPRTSSLPGRARRRHRQWHVSLRHVVDVPVVRSVQFPQVLFFGFYACPVEKADWISSNDEICADYYIYFRFKLKGKGCSEQWEVFLYGDKTIKVDRDSSEVLPRGVSPPGICCVGFGSSPNLETDHTIFELCLPSERCMGMSMNLADPVSSGKYCGTCVSTAPAADPAVMSFTVHLLGSTIVATAAVGTTCFASADCTVSRLQCAARVLTSPCRVMVQVLPMVHTILFGVRCR